MNNGWSKKTPTEEGWYWIRYKNKRNKIVECTCFVSHFDDGTVVVNSAYNDSFKAGPNHGGPELKYDGKVDKSIRFGEKILGHGEVAKMQAKLDLFETLFQKANNDLRQQLDSMRSTSAYDHFSEYGEPGCSCD